MKSTLIASALGLLIAPAWAQTTPQPSAPAAPPAATPSEHDTISKEMPQAPLSKSDKKTIEELAKMNSAELKLSEVAVDKASNEEVKHFAKQMVDEHGKTNKELKELAMKKGVDLPEPAQPPAATVRDEQRLSKLSGEKFDLEYMKVMVTDHRKVVDKVEQTASSATDPALKSWAEKTTPTVQQHLEMAKNTEKALKTKM